MDGFFFLPEEQASSKTFGATRIEGPVLIPKSAIKFLHIEEYTESPSMRCFPCITIVLGKNQKGLEEVAYLPLGSLDACEAWLVAELGVSASHAKTLRQACETKNHRLRGLREAFVAVLDTTKRARGDVAT